MIFLLSAPDVDECEDLMPCDDNATCTNTDGSFMCACDTGYSGDGRTCNSKTLTSHSGASENELTQQ